MRTSEATDPILILSLVGDVMVSRDIEERHFQVCYETLEFIPLAVELILVGRVSFNQVADTHHELRLEQIQLFDCRLKDTRAMPSRSVRNNRELEIAWTVFQVQTTPWIWTGFLRNSKCRYRC